MTRPMRIRTPDEINNEIIAALRPSHTAQLRADLGALLGSSRWMKLGVDYRLTPREVQVAKLAAVGYRTREIAKALGNSPGTVKVHLWRLMTKVGVRSRAGLSFKLLLAAGLIQTQKGDL